MEFRAPWHNIRVEHTSDSKLKDVDYIVMFDPGSEDYYNNDCDQRENYGQPTQGQTLVRFLESHPNANLVIFSGEVTLGKKVVNGHKHAGIQNYLFNDVRASKNANNPAGRVVVCTYEKYSHQDIYPSFRNVVNQAKITKPADCPKDTNHGTNYGWQPRG